MSYTFWVTSNCNLKCKYCYEGEEKPHLTMTKTTVDKATEYVLNHFNSTNSEKLDISIHGGEPFLEFDMVKYIVKTIKERCMFMKIDVGFFTTTNATLLNNEIINFIVEEMPDITISIDGRKETHDKLRPFKGGQGSHEIVLKNCIKLLKRLPNIRVRMTFDSNTVNDLFKNVQFLVNVGFRFIVPAPNLFDKYWDTKELKILEEQIRLIKDYLKDIPGVSISLIEQEIYSVKDKCNAGITSFHIYPDGKIYPCILAAGNDEFCLGDIIEGINLKKRDFLLNFSGQKNPDCVGCALYRRCDGVRCKIINKVITGDFNIPPLMQCAMENLKFRLNKFV